MCLDLTKNTQVMKPADLANASAGFTLLLQQVRAVRRASCSDSHWSLEAASRCRQKICTAFWKVMAASCASCTLDRNTRVCTATWTASQDQQRLDATTIARVLLSGGNATCWLCAHGTDTNLQGTRALAHAALADEGAGWNKRCRPCSRCCFPSSVRSLLIRATKPRWLC